MECQISVQAYHFVTTLLLFTLGVKFIPLFMSLLNLGHYTNLIPDKAGWFRELAVDTAPILVNYQLKF